MILIAFRHGLRPVEVCNLRWDSIDLAKARIHVNRAKNGEPSTPPLSGVELRVLLRLKRESIESPFVFVSERGSPLTTAGYRKMICAELLDRPWPVRVELRITTLLEDEDWNPFLPEL